MTYMYVQWRSTYVHVNGDDDLAVRLDIDTDDETWGEQMTVDPRIVPAQLHVAFSLCYCR